MSTYLHYIRTQRECQTLRTIHSVVYVLVVCPSWRWGNNVCAWVVYSARFHPIISHPASTWHTCKSNRTSVPPCIITTLELVRSVLRRNVSLTSGQDFVQWHSIDCWNHMAYNVECVCGRLHLKCDGTRAETRFRLSAKWTSPFKSAEASVHSTTGSRGVCISGSNVMFRGSVKGTGCPLHSPVSLSLPLPCVTVCHHVSTGLHRQITWRKYGIFSIQCSPTSATALLSERFPGFGCVLLKKRISNWWNDNDRESPKHSAENLPQGHSAHYISHGLVAWDRTRTSTVEACNWRLSHSTARSWKNSVGAKWRSTPAENWVVRILQTLGRGLEPMARAPKMTRERFPWHAALTVVRLLLLLLLLLCLLSQAFSSWYFSWTSGDLHRSGFKLHTAVLSVLCVMFQV